jgi:hypothetical protein
METVEDLAKSKGMVLVGERIGRTAGRRAAEATARYFEAELARGGSIPFEWWYSSERKIAGLAGIGAKGGGIVGLALDFATSPGGDTILPVPVYQATRSDQLIVPGAAWHAHRADAESEARAYTAATGIATTVDESNTKSIGGLPDEGPPIPLGQPLEKHGNWWVDPATGEYIGWDPLWFLH